MTDYRIIAGRPVKAGHARPYALHPDEPEWLWEIVAGVCLVAVLVLAAFLPG